MQIGMIGLGRMGANMAERLRSGGHEVIGYDRNPDVSDVGSLSELVDRLTAPRAAWVMVPAGGDVRAGSTKQLASAIGEGVTGLLMIRQYLQKHSHQRRAQPVMAASG